MRNKIVLIGAGSAVFTKGLVLDILERKEQQWHVALVDTDEHALNTIRRVCEKMIAHMGTDTELSASTDRCDVLPGADYVVSTIGVGGRRAWEQDVFIPRKYGVYQPVGDTIGPGGISRAMRMIPQLVDIAKELERITKDLEKAKKNLAGLEGKLNNEKFVSRAPEAVVAAEREKAQKAKDLIASLEESLAALQKMA